MRAVSTVGRQVRSNRRPALIDSLESRLMMAVQPVISEFLADNKSTNVDPDGNYSDWIEIYNPDPAAQNVGGYYLTDDATQLTKWQIPANTTIPANGYLLVWANSTAVPIANRPLYANFSLAKDGEYLALVQPDGTTINTQFAPSFPAQGEDKSYGLAGTSVTSPTYGVLPSPTPGRANSSTVNVDAPVFSVERGFYDAPFSLTLTAGPGVSIRYTTDGSAPSTSAGTVYSSPISITTTKIVRAIAYKTGQGSSPVIAQSYIFLNDVVRQPASLPGFPNVSKAVGDDRSVRSDTEMDPNIVNNSAYSGMIKNALKSIPSISLSMKSTDLFGSSGVYDQAETATSEKPVSVEIIDPNDPGLNSGTTAAVEGHSGPFLKRALRLSFKSGFGPTKWHTNLLQHGPINGDSANDELDGIVLRAGRNRSWAQNDIASSYAEDAWMRATQAAMNGGAASHSRFVHLYINGAYWGLYDAAERPDETWQAETFGGDSTQYFSVNHGERRSGDATRWNYLMNTLVPKDLSQASNYAQVQQYLDVGQFADYLIANFYAGTTDWPGNNWYAGHRTGSNPSLIQFYSWDAEKTWGIGHYQQVEIGIDGAFVHPAFKTNSTDSSPLAKLWRSIRKSSDFMAMFADRVHAAIANNGTLTDANSLARFEALTNDIKDAIVGESARWGDALEPFGVSVKTKANWQSEVNNIKGMISGNGDQLLGALRGQGYYPTLNAARFAGQRGGVVPAGTTVTLTNPNSSGTIYYTLNGTDPRTSGGGTAGSAIAYTGPITLSASATIRFRVRGSSSSWSAADFARFDVTPLGALRVTEINYHPAARPDVTPFEEEMEFIELQNTGSTPLNLNGVKFDNGIEFTFGNVTLPAGAFAVVAKNMAVYALRYPGAPAPLGQYTGALDNEGDRIRLSTADNVTLLDFRYEDGDGSTPADAGWPTLPDGGGRTLMAVNASAVPITFNNASAWRASDRDGGTPGGSNAPIVNLAPVVNAATTTPTITLADAASLTSTFTDDDLPGGPKTTTWSKVSGPGVVTFGSPSAADTTATFSLAGTYVLRATVSDGALAGFAQVTIVVQPANLPPVLQVSGPASVALNRIAKLVATATDDNLPTVGTTRPVTWSKVSGPGEANFAPDAAPNTTAATFTAEGTYVLEATATDGQYTVTKQLTIVVTAALPPNAQPTVTIAPVGSVTLPNTAALVASVTDDGQPNAATLLWSKTSGPGTVTFAPSNAANTTASFSAPGTYVLNLMANDGELQGSGEVTVEVVPAPNPNAIVSLTLINNATKAVIATITPGSTINLATLPTRAVDIYANAATTTVKSVRFGFDAAPGTFRANVRTDSAAPFSLFASPALTTNLRVGNHRITAQPFAAINGGGTAGAVVDVAFSVIDAPSPTPPAAPGMLTAAAATVNSIRLNWPDLSNNETGFQVEASTDGGQTFTLLRTTAANTTTVTLTALQSDTAYQFRVRAVNAFGQSDYSNVAALRTLVAPAVQRLVLVNADTEQDVLTLTDGMTISRASLPGLLNFNVRAETNTLTKSVVFGYGTTVTFRRENAQPFALFGKTGTNYAGQAFTAKTYTITVTPFSTTAYSGTRGTPLKITFTVV